MSIPHYRTKLLSAFDRRGTGPLATDEQSKRIFVGDGKRILAVKYDGGKAQQIANDMGEVRSLAVDSARRRLYAGDVAGNRIWQLSLAEDNSPTIQFVDSQSVQSPTGLGIDSKGNLWVGDADKRALLLFSPDGRLLQTISSK
jgi:sugar lactone lactonase YvrE